MASRCRSTDTPMMTTEQLDVRTVAGHLRPRRARAAEARRRAVRRAPRVRPERHRAEPSAALNSLGLSWGRFTPRTPAVSEPTDAPASPDAIRARERGPIVCTGMGGPDCSPPPPPPRPSRTAAAMLTSCPDDTARDDTAQDVTALRGWSPAVRSVREDHGAAAPVGVRGAPGLRADLDAGAAADVALVCAPAGYGKTLLLADWARTSTGDDTAWVGIDHGDNDPRRLWSAVLAAVARCPSVPAAAAARPVAPAARRPTRIHRRVRRCAEPGAADPADPRRRAGTGRPARAGEPPHLHPGQARDRPARAGQPARSTAVAAPVTAGRPALGAARRPVVLHAAPGRGAAGELGAAAVTAAGRGPAPAHRGVGRGLAAGRSRPGGVCRPRGVPHPVLR